jgi:hypothetical protein
MNRGGMRMNTGRLLTLCALAAAALPGPAPAAQPDPLGRLFFTPAQRASLDVARSQRARTAVGTERTEQEAAPVSQTITYGGLLRRNDGKTTVWLNNQPVHDNDPSGAGAVVSRVRPDGRITLQAPQSARSVELKPGQSVELLSGTIEEGYSRRALSESEPKPKPGSKPGTKDKPSPTGAARAAEQEREERQQQIIEDAVSRAITETAAARPGAPLAPPPPAR